MKFRKIFVSLIIFAISIFVISSVVSAWPWSKKKKKAEDYYPLYVNVDHGWGIYAGVPSERMISIYLRAKEIVESFGGSDVDIEYWEYVINHGVDNFYDFVLFFHENEKTFWSKKSQIVMTYIAKKDTFEVASRELIFAKMWPQCKQPMIRSSEIKSYYPIPNQYIYHTPHGHPVIIARFDFDKNRPRPELIIKCSVRNVITSVKSEKEMNKHND